MALISTITVLGRFVAALPQLQIQVPVFGGLQVQRCTQRLQARLIAVIIEVAATIIFIIATILRPVELRFYPLTEAVASTQGIGTVIVAIIVRVVAVAVRCLRIEAISAIVTYVDVIPALTITAG